MIDETVLPLVKLDLADSTVLRYRTVWYYKHTWSTFFLKRYSLRVRKAIFPIQEPPPYINVRT